MSKARECACGYPISWHLGATACEVAALRAVAEAAKRQARVLREWDADKNVLPLAPECGDGKTCDVRCGDGTRPGANEYDHAEAHFLAAVDAIGVDTEGSRQTGDEVRIRLADTDGGGGAAVHLDEPLVCEDCDEPVDECVCDANAMLSKAMDQERDRAIRYLRNVSAANHPTYIDAFLHAARQLENNAHRIGVSTAPQATPPTAPTP